MKDPWLRTWDVLGRLGDDAVVTAAKHGLHHLIDRRARTNRPMPAEGSSARTGRSMASRNGRSTRATSRATLVGV